MKTFGFRGEALASISHVARVTVITKTEDSVCAYKAEYLNGAMVNEPSPTAGNRGTTIIVADLFYNLPMRLKGMTSPSEEYAQILRVLQRYAIQQAGKVGLSCKKSGLSSSDLQVTPPVFPTFKDVIKAVFGTQLSKSLVTIDTVRNEALEVSISGCVSIPTFHQKSTTFILFINGRLVESSHIRKAVSNLYSQLLPKGTGPFVFLCLEIAPQNVDVNVHPTKSEVFFLHELQIAEFLDRTVRMAIESSSIEMQNIPMIQPVQDRITSTFTKKGESKCINYEEKYSQEATSSQTVSTPKEISSKVYPFQMVHSDPKTRTIDDFVLKKRHKAEIGTESKVPPAAKLNESEETSEDPRNLTSVKSLINSVKQRKHEDLTDMIRNSVMVGMFDKARMLLQYQSQLLMIEHARFAVDMFYQKCLLGFGFHDRWKLPEPVDLSPSTLEVLIDKSELLLEYFSIQLLDGKVIALPRLIEGIDHVDDSLVIELMEALGNGVNWEDEESCFHDLSEALAIFFTSLVMEQPRLEEYIRHYLYMALKGCDLSRFGHLIGYDRNLVRDGAITELTSTHELYKVFERC